MKEFLKSAAVERSVVLDDKELALINRQTLREMGADELFVFRLAACGNKVDRDFERFTDGALEKMAELFVGKPVLQDHKWSSGTQTARVYAAEVESQGDYKRLVLRCYMPREGNSETIVALESGVLRECSVGLAVGKVICSICGADQRKAMCQHFHGREYNGKICHFDLDDPRDCYEVSLVAVPAQSDAGAIKSKRYGINESDQDPGADAPDDDLLKLAKARMELEEKRYGGNES